MGLHEKTVQITTDLGTREKKLQSRNVTSYFYSSLILVYFKTLYILLTVTLTLKVKSALSIFLKHSKTL